MKNLTGEQLEVHFQALKILMKKVRQDIVVKHQSIAWNWWNEVHNLGGPSYFLDSSAWHILNYVIPRYDGYIGTLAVRLDRAEKEEVLDLLKYVFKRMKDWRRRRK